MAEADEVSPEDLEAAGAMHNKLQAGTFYNEEGAAKHAMSVKAEVFQVSIDAGNGKPIVFFREELTGEYANAPRALVTFATNEAHGFIGLMARLLGCEMPLMCRKGSKLILEILEDGVT